MVREARCRFNDYFTVSRKHPCEACQKTNWCRRFADGRGYVCFRQETSPLHGKGRPTKGGRGQGWVFFTQPGSFTPAADRGPDSDDPDNPLPPQDHHLPAFQKSLEPEHIDQLATNLSLPLWVVKEGLPRNQIGYDHDEKPRGNQPSRPGFIFPLYDHRHWIVAFLKRDVYRTWPLDEKGEPENKRYLFRQGLAVPIPIERDLRWFKGLRSHTIFVVEGWSDSLVLNAMGLVVIGVPGNGQKPRTLARYLAKHNGRIDRVYVLSEHDLKDDGKWPGRSGAYRLAKVLAKELPAVEVFVAPVPDQKKDSREWAIERLAGSEDRLAWQDAGFVFRFKVEASAVKVTSVPPAKLNIEPGRCERQFHRISLSGKGDKAGKRIVASCKCERWKDCKGCRKWQQKRWSHHLYDVILAWCAPDLLLRSDDPAEQDPATAQAPRTTATGPWTLLAGYFAEDRVDAAKQSLRKLGAEFASIRTEDAEITEHIGFPDAERFRRMREEEVRTGNTFRVLVLAAVPPDAQPPLGFAAVGAEDGIDAMNSAVLHAVNTGSDGKVCRPVATSRGWKLPEPLPSDWQTEGNVPYTVQQVAEITEEIGVATKDKLNSDRVIESTGWSEAAAGGPLAARYLQQMLSPEPDQLPLDPDQIVRLFREWRRDLAGLADGYAARNVLERYGRLPPDVAARRALASAVRVDEECAIPLLDPRALDACFAERTHGDAQET